MKGPTIFLLGCLILFGCKKTPQSITATTVCDTTITAIAGKYHLTKMEQVAYSTGAAIDVTSTLSSCELQAVYNLKADSTATYTENAPCSSNGSGRWQLNDKRVGISLSPCNGDRINLAYFLSWDCSKLVFMTAFPSVVFNYRYTLTKFE